jgi:threonine synthase
MRVRCNDCGKEAEFTLTGWRCDCDGAWEPADQPAFNSALIEAGDRSIWRYGRLLGLDIAEPSKRMGVGGTPLVAVDLFNQNILLKLEYLSPSGSFKDRGVNAMVNQLVRMGVETVVEDSSGNAGASLAAHTARFGLQAEIYVPATASPAKQQQIALYGAMVKPIPGPRQAASDAAQAAIRPGTAYASHAYNPAYLAGQMTVAWEVWEQLGRMTPDWVVLPVAQGGQFLGYWFGFKRLLEAGLIERLPRLVAVQAERIAPIHRAWFNELDRIPAIEAEGPTLAEGIAIPRPVRDKRILQALLESNGLAVAVGERAIRDAQTEMAHLGYYIEPTSAAAIAGLREIADEIGDGERVVISLTGNGLKGKPQQI